ncbi:unnamed protein product [Somion occarium]|uniref:Endoglucanase n=1 Tax=Somion occarium TaxID=3059160 RepID=A0ABP1D3J2_9APHY
MHAVRLLSTLFVTFVYFSTSLAQLPLPNSTYLPPNASFGVQHVNDSQKSSVDPHWSSLLGNLLWFYEAQRSGKLPSNKRVPWRNDSAVEDGRDAGLDLSGGYYDAGDYVKYTYPLSFSLMSICWGAVDFGGGYDSANQTAYLDDMLRWGLDWLIKAHPSPNTLFVQVGDGDVDNAYWGGDLGIPTPRTSYQINETSPGTDAAAQASAAFSACSALYANHSLSSVSNPASLTNISYASTLLSHAQQLYTFATNTTERTYQTSVPVSGQAYASSGFTDELTLASLFLSLASNSSQLYSQAVSDYQNFHLDEQIRPGSESVFNWDGKSPGIVVLGAQIAKMYPNLASSSTSVNWTLEAEDYLDGIVKGRGRTFLTDGGLLWYPGDSNDASLNPALNAALLLTRYATSNLPPSSQRNSYLTFAQSQLNYTLGANPMNVPYIVGTHPNSPQNPHSAIATGASPYDIANIDTVPEHERYVLYGAVVGGPDTRDRFWDLRSDWVQGEVALDYNAPLLSLVAYTIMNQTTATQEPVFVSIEEGSYVKPKNSPCDDAVKTGCGIHPWPKGAKIAFAVVITIVGLIILGFGTYWIVLATRNSTKVG